MITVAVLITLVGALALAIGAMLREERRYLEAIEADDDEHPDWRRFK